MDEDVAWEGLLVLDSETYKLAELGARLRRTALDDYVQALASYDLGGIEPLWCKDDGA
jgi:hypothetical protein